MYEKLAKVVDYIRHQDKPIFDVCHRHFSQILVALRDGESKKALQIMDSVSGVMPYSILLRELKNDVRGRAPHELVVEMQSVKVSETLGLLQQGPIYAEVLEQGEIASRSPIAWFDRRRSHHSPEQPQSENIPRLKKSSS